MRLQKYEQKKFFHFIPNKKIVFKELKKVFFSGIHKFLEELVQHLTNLVRFISKLSKKTYLDTKQK